MKNIAFSGRFIWFVGVLLLLIPSGLYFYIFIPASNSTLSENHAAWASFGSYFGGTIGPIISGFAFIGVWKTYNLQRQQLQQANAQRKSEDIQRLIASTSERIDSILKHPVDLIKIINGGKQRSELYNIEIAISFLNGVNKDKSHELRNKAPEIKFEITTQIAQIVSDAENLSWLLEHQKLIFNEDTITNYYYYRYGEIFKKILNIGFDLQPTTLDVFDLHNVKTEE